LPGASTNAVASVIAAGIVTTKQYADPGFIQEVNHTTWFSPHADSRKPRDEREPLTFCLDQIDDGTMSFHWGGGYVETKEHGTMPCVTEEVFWKMANAVERGPRDIIRVVFDDYGTAFCTKGGMKWLSKAMMLQLRHIGVYVLSLCHRACENYFPAAMGILFDSYVIFKPAMDSAKELRHILLSCRMDWTPPRVAHFILCVSMLHAQWMEARPTRTRSSSRTKKDGLEYFAWRNSDTQFHCTQLWSPVNWVASGLSGLRGLQDSECQVPGSPFDKMLGGKLGNITTSLLHTHPFSHTPSLYPFYLPCAYFLSVFPHYGWMPHNAGFGFLDLTPSILLLRQFWD
jgi:hypothetical protein